MFEYLSVLVICLRWLWCFMSWYFFMICVCVVFFGGGK